MIKRYVQLEILSRATVWSVSPDGWEQLVKLATSKPTPDLTHALLDAIGRRIKRRPEHVDIFRLSTFHHPLYHPSFWNSALQDIKRNKRNTQHV